MDNLGNSLNCEHCGNKFIKSKLEVLIIDEEEIYLCKQCHSWLCSYIINNVLKNYNINKDKEHDEDEDGEDEEENEKYLKFWCNK